MYIINNKDYGDDKVTLQDISEFIDSKIEENDKIVKFTYYELRVKRNKSELETKNIIHLIKIRLENLNYITYKTGEYYKFDGKMNFVENNELLVAVKK